MLAIYEDTRLATVREASVTEGAAPPNKGMKLTSVEHIGRSQLIPGVGRTSPRVKKAPAGADASCGPHGQSAGLEYCDGNTA